MKKKNIRNTKGRIVSTAWKLFYEQGYEDTTVDDIIYESRPPRVHFTTISAERMLCSPRSPISLTINMKS